MLCGSGKETLTSIYILSQNQFHYGYLQTTPNTGIFLRQMEEEGDVKTVDPTTSTPLVWFPELVVLS